VESVGLRIPIPPAGTILSHRFRSGPDAAIQRLSRWLPSTMMLPAIGEYKITNYLRQVIIRKHE